MSARYPAIGDKIRLKRKIGPYSAGKLGVIKDIALPINGEKYYIIQFQNVITGSHHLYNAYRSDFVVPHTPAYPSVPPPLFSFSKSKLRPRYTYDDKEII